MWFHPSKLWLATPLLASTPQTSGYILPNKFGARISHGNPRRPAFSKTHFRNAPNFKGRHWFSKIQAKPGNVGSSSPLENGRSEKSGNATSDTFQKNYALTHASFDNYYRQILNPAKVFKQDWEEICTQQVFDNIQNLIAPIKFSKFMSTPFQLMDESMQLLACAFYSNIVWASYFPCDDRDPILKQTFPDWSIHNIDIENNISRATLLMHPENTTAIVSILGMGINRAKEVLILLDAKPYPLSFGKQYHSGLVKLTHRILKEVAALLSPNISRIVFTGHSMGGACATIAAPAINEMDTQRQEISDMKQVLNALPETSKRERNTIAKELKKLQQYKATCLKAMGITQQTSKIFRQIKEIDIVSISAPPVSPNITDGYKPKPIFACNENDPICHDSGLEFNLLGPGGFSSFLLGDDYVPVDSMLNITFATSHLDTASALTSPSLTDENSTDQSIEELTQALLANNFSLTELIPILTTEFLGRLVSKILSLAPDKSSWNTPGDRWSEHYIGNGVLNVMREYFARNQNKSITIKNPLELLNNSTIFDSAHNEMQGFSTTKNIIQLADSIRTLPQANDKVIDAWLDDTTRLLSITMKNGEVIYGKIKKDAESNSTLLYLKAVTESFDLTTLASNILN